VPTKKGKKESQIRESQDLASEEGDENGKFILFIILF
jgi:hypothetical protein